MVYRSTHTGAEIDEAVDKTEDLGGTIAGQPEKTTPTDNDVFGISDSAASSLLKKLSWSNIKATLKTYFDTVYLKFDNYGLINNSFMKINIGPVGDGELNTVIGGDILKYNTTGKHLVGAGYGVLYDNTVGYDNVALGMMALRYNTTGSGGVAIGTQALFSNTSSYYNVAVGDAALKYTTGKENTALGSYAGYGNITGYGNIFIGNHCCHNITDATEMLFIDNRSRSNAASDLSESLVVGKFSSNANQQWLKINGALNINTSGTRPTAAEEHRGKIWIIRGGVGEADTISFCMKNASDTYEWKTL